MKSNRPYRRLKPQRQKIEELEKSIQRFKRIYSEYEQVSEELWNMENSEDISTPDDFIDATQQQKDFLQHEISDWLRDNPSLEE